MTDRATKSGVSALRPVSQAAVIGGAVVGAVLAVIGVRALFVGGFPTLFGCSLAVIGLLGIVLGLAAWRGIRPAWAVLAATWGVLAFCAFFATPKVFDLPELEAATVEMELKLGRKGAEAEIEERNLVIRLKNLAACALLALPFGLLCAGLLVGSRDWEPVTPRRSE